MIVANQRAYRDAVGWIRAAAPGRTSRLAFAWRRYRAAFMAGLLVMGLLALFDPGAFGQTGWAPSLGWPGWGAVALLVIAIAYWVLRRRQAAGALQRMVEPFLRPLDDHPSFEGATGALAACGSAFVYRFAVGWVWGPAVLYGAGVLLALSDAFFVIDTVLAAGGVGWGLGILFGVDGVLSLVAFALAARRLRTWRLATSVHKAVTTGYEA